VSTYYTDGVSKQWVNSGARVSYDRKFKKRNQDMRGNVEKDGAHLSEHIHLGNGVYCREVSTYNRSCQSPSIGDRVRRERFVHLVQIRQKIPVNENQGFLVSLTLINQAPGDTPCQSTSNIKNPTVQQHLPVCTLENLSL
jgi:hypothetical protein